MASRYWVGGNANWDATAGTKWATTSGGAGGAAVPTSSDDVFLDNGTGTGNVTISGARVCQSLNCTGYVGTLNMGATITVSGNVTLASGMTITGSSALIVNATSTLTSNGKTWPNNLTLTTLVTYTLADDWTVTGTLSVGSTAAGTVTYNGNKFNISTLNVVSTSAIRIVSGTTVFNFNGTSCTWTQTSGIFRCNVTINTASTLTINDMYVGSNTITYTAGTVTVAGTLNILESITLDTNGITWGSVVISGASRTITLNSLFTATGSFTTTSATTTLTFAGTAGFTVGSWTHSVTTAVTIQLKSTNTYTVTTSLILFSTAAQRITLNTSTATSQAKLTLSPGATQSVAFTDPTDIDSSLGQTINAFKPVLSNTLNWRELTANRTKAYAYVQ